MSSMKLTKAVLGAALGVAMLGLISTVGAADEKKSMDKPAKEKCYGVAKAAKNDCAAGTHSCQGQSTKDFDKTSYVELPAGLCGKLAGGSLMAAK